MSASSWLGVESAETTPNYKPETSNPDRLRPMDSYMGRKTSLYQKSKFVYELWNLDDASTGTVYLPTTEPALYRTDRILNIPPQFNRLVHIF
ncbi:hypothetical protein T265_10725 [Opisthorchis viverrini]|uniref:Uncharacterized protein n=1 Tax=Opisthorchis viverrini TaxID=6198 RepID=A0A074Z1F9_OPIVI|nr:hypothetical protein T265_10725 [Opisthorchis viverrini]KER20808.1 hypothetical protein T265_10725 [Opisthorchis viverrini]